MVNEAGNLRSKANSFFLKTDTRTCYLLLLEMFSLGYAFLHLFKRASSTSAASKPVVVFVLGGPGAGKGTQCEKIVKEYGYVHLSAGDLLRKERESGSDVGDSISYAIKNGTIVPVEVTVGLLKTAMAEYSGKPFLIDGFPRNEDNLEGWERIMKDCADVRGVLFFDCPESICVKRILQRSQSSGREDDNEEVVRKRFNTYYNQTMPIVKHYESKGLVMKVNAIPEPDDVFEEVKQTFRQKNLNIIN